jgi:Clr5 domain
MKILPISYSTSLIFNSVFISCFLPSKPTKIICTFEVFEMDSSYVPAFSTLGVSALPSASLFHQAEVPGKQLLQYQKVQEPILVQGLSIATRGKREISRQQWEEMKPLIQRVYIIENRTFRQLKIILRAEYGVEPTYCSLYYYPVLDIALLERF